MFFRQEAYYVGCLRINRFPNPNPKKKVCRSIYTNITATFTSDKPPPTIDAMSINPSPELKSLFEAALSEFEKRAGTNLLRHQIIDRLTNSESVDSVTDILQGQAQAFRTWRGDDGKLMTWLKRTVQVLHSLSTSGVLGESIGLVRIYSPFHWDEITC